jgi:hypothetical protein
MGAGCGSAKNGIGPTARAGDRQSGTERTRRQTLDESAVLGYWDGAYQRAGGAWPLRPPFRFIEEGLRGPARPR